MPPAAKPPTPEERHIRIEALKPAWLRDYIRDLEKINVALYGQLQEANRLAGLRLGLTDDEARVAWRGLDHIGDAALSEDDDLVLRKVYEFFAAQMPPRQPGMAPGPAQRPEGVELSAIGAIFAGTFHVYHGPHSHSAGAKVLVVENHHGPLIILPVADNEVVIARG